MRLSFQDRVDALERIGWDGHAGRLDVRADLLGLGPSGHHTRDVALPEHPRQGQAGEGHAELRGDVSELLHGCQDVVGQPLADELGAAALVARLMRTLLFGVSPLDPLSFAAVPLILATAAAIAAFLPACRVAAINPVDALKEE